MPRRTSERSLRPAGYLRLIEDFGLRCLPPYHRSYVASWDHRRTIEVPDGVEETYPPRYAPAEGLVPELEFALKYDGLELGVLRAFFGSVDRDAWETELTSHLTRRR